MEENETSTKEIEKNQVSDAYAFFLRSISSLTKLKKEETAAYLEQYRKHPSDELRNQIVEGNRCLVLDTANQFTANVYPESRKRSLTLELCQEGSIALSDAVRGFKAESGNAFSTFAVSCIKNRRLSYRQNKLPQVKTPTSIQKTIKIVSLLQKEYAKTHTSLPSKQERISLSKGSLTRKDLDDLSDYYQKKVPLSLDSTISAGSDSPTFEESQADDSSLQPDSVSSENEQFSLRQKALASLKPIEKDILLSRSNLAPRKTTLRELSEKYKISKERCRQIEERAKEKVKQYLSQFE